MLASLLVQEMGLEPTLLSQQVPETCASAYSATPAHIKFCLSFLHGEATEAEFTVQLKIYFSTGSAYNNLSEKDKKQIGKIQCEI